MNLDELKSIIDKAGFPEEVQVELDEIVEAAIVAGELSAQTKQKLLEIIDSEILSDEEEASDREEFALALQAYLSAVDSAAGVAEENLKALANKSS